MAPAIRLFGWAMRKLQGRTVAELDRQQMARLSAMSIHASPWLRFITGFPRWGVTIEDRKVPGCGAPIGIRIYRPRRAPNTPLPLVLNIHGGGWVLGGRCIADWIASTVARDLGAVVVSVDYRLAPAHPFPAAIDDCYDALTWAAANAGALGGDAARLSVMGESAGGNLAAVVCLLAQARAGPTIRHQALIYPATEIGGQTPSRREQVDALILTTADLAAFEAAYSSGHSAGIDWLLSPLRAPNHEGLPPTLVQVAGHDPLTDEGIAYARKLAEAGGDVRLTRYPAMPHGYLNLPYFSRDARRAMREIVAEQKRHLAVH